MLAELAGLKLTVSALAAAKPLVSAGAGALDAKLAKAVAAVIAEQVAERKAAKKEGK